MGFLRQSEKSRIFCSGSSLLQVPHKIIFVVETQILFLVSRVYLPVLMKSTKPRKPFILVQDSDDTFFLIKLIDITLPTGLILLSFPMNRVNNQTPKNTITHVPNKSVRKFLSLPWLCSLDCNFPYHWEILYHLSMFLFPNLLPLIRWSFLLLYSFFVNIFLHYLGSAFVNCTPQLCLPVTFLIIGKCILIATSFLLCYCWYLIYIYFFNCIDSCMKNLLLLSG